jgi:hypothetical protein
VASSSPVMIGGVIQFNAQGTYVAGNKKKPKFRDITNNASTSWLDQPANIVQYNSNGQYQAVANGCACVQVSVAGILSQSVSVTVGTPSPACTPCPQ